MSNHDRTIALFAASVATLSLGLASCEQPGMSCTAAQSGSMDDPQNALAFATTYQRTRVVSGTHCPDAPPELVGFAVYHASRDTPDGPVRDFTKRTVAIRSGTMGALAAEAEDAGLVVHEAALSALGPFSALEPDEDGFCHVPTLAPAELVHPEVTTSAGKTVPAANLRYEWKDVRLYVTPAVPGTQFSATVIITSGACSVEHRAIGMWPAISCASADGAGAPDDTLCDPEPDPAKGRTSGSGINPDFGPVVCDPTILRCVLRTDRIPALEGRGSGEE